MDGIAQAYIQGGATLVLLLFAGYVFRWMAEEIKRLRLENLELRKAGEVLLQSYQARDQERLRAYEQDSAMARRMAAAAPGSPQPPTSPG